MSADLTFGPAADEWHYDLNTKTYDLTRGGGAGAGFTLRTTQGPEETRITIAPEKTALVVVDMQNYFLDKTIRDHPTGLAAVGPTLDLVSKCRKLDIQASTPPARTPVCARWGEGEETS